MKKNRIIELFLACSLLWVISCSEQGEVTSSNDLSTLQSESPVLIADGLSQTQLIATVYDSSGSPAKGVVVKFVTTFGTITETAYTDWYGEAVAVLKSFASETDVVTTITATIVPPADEREATAGPTSLALKVKNSGTNEKLDKGTAISGMSATTQILLLGVTLSAQIDQSDLPADGISTSAVRVSVKETTSHRGINDARVSFRARYASVTSGLEVDESGLGSAPLQSWPHAASDTLVVEYGNLFKKTIPLQFIPVQLSLTPKNAEVVADGSSKMLLLAKLYSHRNNPIPGANVRFTTSDGLVSSTAITNSSGEAQAELVSSSRVQNDVKVIASFYDVADTSLVDFVTTTATAFEVEAPQQVVRNGNAISDITVTLLNNLQMPVANTRISFTASKGVIDSAATTDSNGRVHVLFVPDAGESDALSTIQVACFALKTSFSIKLLGVTFDLHASPQTIPANGIATSMITASLKYTTSQQALAYTDLQIATTLGSIPALVSTNASGVAQVQLEAGTVPGSAFVQALFGTLSKTVLVTLAGQNPSSIGITANPNFIWVTETGNLEQTVITATVYNESGQLAGDETGVRFILRNGPNGGERLLPSLPGNPRESTIVRTMAGQASIALKSGTRSGPVEVLAELADFPDVTARSTNITIRSGPPYIWVDPADPNHVESHMTIAQDYFNQEGWNHVRRFNLSVYIGDKYNNPVDEGTTVYLTTTAGIVTSDIRTDAYGEGKAIWTTANPKPYILPADPLVLAPHRVPNPNAPGTFLPFILADFEGSVIRNSFGTTDENDGIGLVIATTHGRDQNGNDAIVFSSGTAVFSGPIAVFEAHAVKTTLETGEATTIFVRLFDINGNPMAKGSTLSASASAGKLSATDLMAKTEQYGFGTTFFATQLSNTLDPLKDESKMAEVTFKLESPNGTGTITVYVYLRGL